MDEAPIRVDRDDDWITVRWAGDVDMANAASLEHGSLAAVENTDVGLTVDLGAVGYIDSAGIRALISMRRLLDERQQRLSIILPKGSVLTKALEIGGITSVIETYPSEEEARAAR